MSKILLTIVGFGILVSLSFCKGKSNQNTESESLRKTESVTKQIMNGDIIFQTSLSSQSQAIQAATGSKYSHMGIIYYLRGELFVYEATQPVRLTMINKWISSGKNGHYVIKRLRNAEEILTKEVLVDMKSIGEKFKGKNYDLYFEWSDERIYCSELVWKIYNEALGIEIGKLEKLSDFDLESEMVKKKMTERYGENIPMNEKVISPGQMFDSELLVEVISN